MELCKLCGSEISLFGECTYCYHCPSLKFNHFIALETKSEMNQRGHWTKRYKRFKIQQKILYYDWWVKLKEKPKTPCIVLLIRVMPRDLDLDNLPPAFKDIQDSISELLVPEKKRGFGDGVNYLKFCYGQEKPNKSKRKGLRIIIQDCEESFWSEKFWDEKLLKNSTRIFTK